MESVYDCQLQTALLGIRVRFREKLSSQHIYLPFRGQGL